MPRRTLPVIGLALGLLILCAATAAAQFMYVPYYGKNRVVYEKFPWKIYPTDHFQIYFYTADDRILKNVADFAESAYAKVSRALKHDLAKPVPILYYTTITDMEQSNVFQAQEGLLGVSEPVMFRIGLQGDMPDDELQAVICHELVHIFEFDLLWGDKGGVLAMVSQPPLWTFEGLSEYITGIWSSWSTLLTRDAVLNDRIPEFSESGEMFSRYPIPREPAYDFGHALYEFIVERYGPNAVRDLWRGLKGTPLLGRRDPIERVFKMKLREFSVEYKRYLRARFKDYFTRENPEDYSVAIGPEFPMNPYYFAFSQALSPSGDLVATITFNALEGDIDIVLLSTKDGRVLRNITKGYTLKYESIKFEIDPTYGTSLAWSRDGNELAFFGRKGRRHALFIISALTGSTLREIELGQDQPAGPCFFPDGKKILFGAYEKGRRDFFRGRVVRVAQEHHLRLGEHVGGCGLEIGEPVVGLVHRQVVGLAADEHAASRVDGIADSRHERVVSHIDEGREQVRKPFLAADEREDLGRRVELDTEAPTHPFGTCLTVRLRAGVGRILVVPGNGDRLGHGINDALRRGSVRVPDAERYDVDTLSLLCLLLAVDLGEQVRGQVVHALGDPHRASLLMVGNR
jgi:hypothetical protein